MKSDEVQLYEVVRGRLFAGEYPGWPGSDPTLARKRLKFVVGKGVSTFINLTTIQDRLEPYADFLPEIAPGLRQLSFPIRDMDVPDSEGTMSSVMEAIRSEMEAGRGCYVHCWGGIGRTGTVIGCYLREQGMGPEESLETVQKLYASGMPKIARHPHSPQTLAQCDYVRSWGKR